VPAVRVKLLRAHEDAGRQYAAGDVLVIDRVTAKWLVDNKVGVAVPPEKVAASSEKG
jgi:hypothetical protein